MKCCHRGLVTACKSRVISGASGFARMCIAMQIRQSKFRLQFESLFVTAAYCCCVRGCFSVVFSTPVLAVWTFF